MIPKIFLLLLFMFLSVSIKAQETSECTPAEGTPIRIGAVFPQGDLFSLDAAAPIQGVQAMVKAFNECSGKRPVELVYIPANNRAQALDAVEKLDVPLIIGSGSAAVSEALTEASTDGDFVYWEVTEPLDNPHEWAFSPRPNNIQLGQSAASFVINEIPALIEGRVPRVAFLYEKRAQTIADGILDTLQPLITRGYSNNLESPYRLAVQIREAEIDVVMVATFEGDAEFFWDMLRQADANITAWVQVGSQLSDTCDSFAAISVDASGEVDRRFRHNRGGEVYTRYEAIYEAEFDEAPNEQADLAASGVYLLLEHLLEGDIPETIREDIFNKEVDLSSGLMGEGWTLENNLNTAISPIIQQRQTEGFCSVLPGNLATCTNPLQSFPTWRERAVARSRGECGVDNRDTASLLFQ
jgi:hypothetical protein